MKVWMYASNVSIGDQVRLCPDGKTTSALVKVTASKVIGDQVILTGVRTLRGREVEVTSTNFTFAQVQVMMG